MKDAIAQPKVSAPKPESKNALKALPMPALEKRLGASPNGLTHAEAAKRPM
jgi:H+-transporting ATPase